MTNPNQTNARYLVVLVLLAVIIACVRVVGFTPTSMAIPHRWLNLDHRDLADVPEEMRKRNWTRLNGGSCVHASLVTLLRYQGLDGMAEWWIQTYDGGENFNRLTMRLDAAHIQYATAMGPDAEPLLEWAMRNRLGAVIGWTDDQAREAHALTIVDLTPAHAVLLDNNHIGQYRYVDRDEFFRIWRRSGTIMLTLVYSPPPPLPSIQ